MKNLKLEEIVKNVTRFVAQSGMDYEAFNPLTQGIGEIFNVLEVTGLLPQVTSKTCKSDGASERLRASGNQAFISAKNDMEALQLYTKAIGAANPNGKIISLAYANRSAVTFALGEYNDSIKDIDRALSGNYPEHLRPKLIERRGKCYAALSLYNEALDDFRVCKTLISKCNVGLDKIDMLSSQIDKLMEQSTEASIVDPPCAECEVLPRLSHLPSLHVQCASSAVDIKFCPQMGRHVVAATDIFPGDVLAIEKPFASVLLPPSYTLFCDFCKKRCHSSVPCLYCCDIMFCNEVCRDKSWSTHHSIECELLPSLIAMGCDKMELLSVRVLLIATECGKSFQKLIESYYTESSNAEDELKGFVNTLYLSDNYCSTHNLETNCESRSDEDLFRRGSIAACIIHILKESTNFFKFTDLSFDMLDNFCGKFTIASDLSLAHVLAGDLILRYLMSAPCNAHEIAEMRVWPAGNDLETDSSEIGGAIYPFHSLINHSCDPNVVRHAFNGDTVVLTSIQLIKKGEQIFDNYGYHHAIHDLTTRQEHLKTQYYFTCECPACTNDWPLYHDLPDGSPSYTNIGVERAVQLSSEKFTSILTDIKSGKTSDENVKFLTQHLTLLHKNVQRPWKEYNQCQEAIKQCLSLKANHYVFKKKL